MRGSTLVEVLRRRASETPDRPAYLFLADGEAEAERLTWAELDARVRTVAAALSAEVPRGERALLLYPPGLEFVAAFLGCLAAGIIAVPAYPPRPRRDQPRLRAILGDATPRIALTTAELAAGLPEMGAVRPLATDTLPAAPGWEGPLPEAESIAFLQYTSGSTSLPKGVTVTHANLVHNSGMIQRAFQQDEESVVVGWLPLYHDMGLIGNVLQPLWCGGRCVLMAPVAFLQRPRRWLEAIGRYRATTSGGPNFAYELCAHKVGPAEREGLDLSSWRVAFNGAEPVRAEALERFAAAFAPQGFRREAFYPCYGLAEATLFVSGATPGEPVRVETVDAGALERHEAQPAGEGPARRLVSCGRAWEGQRIAIADPESAPETGVELPPGRVGEVWVAGPSVAAGYWRRPEVTERDFQARLASGEGPFLRTGDLGFMAGGELFVTGRLKDLIILRGRNHYPQDLERTAEASHPELRPGGAAAFAVEVDGEERLVVALEVERRRRADLAEIAGAVRRAVAEEHEVQVHEVVLLKPGGLPKTSSGKVQRHACRAGYLDGTLEALGTSAVGKRAEAPPRRPAPSREELAALPEAERREAVLAWLGDRVAALAGLGTRPAPDQPLTELGLDSLSAVELKGEVEAAFGGTVPLIELLGGWGIGEVAEWALIPPGEGEAMGRIGPTGRIGPMIREGVRGLSTGQEALWFLERLAPTGGAYNIAVAARVVGTALDAEALRRALLRLAERHPALRTTFHAEADGAPVQRVGAPAVDFAVAQSEDGLMAEAWRPFDLENGPLLRVRLLAGGSVVLLAVHHLIADFWSLAVASRELGALYREETGGPAAELPPLQEDYTGFVERQREMLAGPRGEALWSFWRQALAGPPPDLDLPTDLPRPPLPSFRGGARAARLTPELADGARSLARQSGTTLFTTLLAVWQTLLGRWTGQEDFAVGSPTAGREADLAGVVGYFVNPVPLRADLTGDPPFAAHLERTRSAALAALEHADYPLPLLVERLHPSRDPSRSPLFQTMLILQAARPGEDPGLAAFSLGESGARVDLGGLVLESLALGERRAQFDLTLRLAPVADGGLGAVLEYAADLFMVDTAGRMLGHFQNLLAGAVADPARRLWGLPLLSADERRQLLVDWNEAGWETPRRDVCLHELFAAQVDRTPEAEALVDGTRRLTYADLAARSRHLAEELRRLGAGPEVRVGVCLPRSADLVAALLGVLEAGGAYVPLDPAYPKERVAFMLEDSGAQVLVTSREAAVDVPGFGGRWLKIDEEDPNPLAEGPFPLGGVGLGQGEGQDGGDPSKGNLDHQGHLDGGRPHLDPPPAPTRPRPEGGRPRPTLGRPYTPPPLPGRGAGRRERGPGGEGLAYLIYTSGSTGRPKGVAIEHRSAAALVDWSRSLFSAEDLTGVLAATSVCFDLSVFEIFVPLSRGGRVILAENALALPKLPAAAEVTLVNTVPSAMAELVRSGSVPRSVRVINLAGEPIPPGLARAIHRLEGPRLYDLYGPSEDTTYSTGTQLLPGGDVTIGRPIAGTRGYLLGRRGEPVPAGVPGELFLGGAGLARGYLGRPDLTAERFVPNPFGDETGGRLYRTGDLVRLRRDGDLDFLGRIDHQVKVRGFRIELGEVEAAIARLPEVRGVTVLALDDGDRGRRLVAFVATDLTDLSAVRDALRRELPEPMVPTRWVPLPELPLTPNGKVDRRALARLEVRSEPAQPGGDVPRTRTEQILAALWSEILGVPRVGRHDNFFDLGGHSLLATRLAARLQTAFGVEPPLAAFFENPTVARLAAYLERTRGGAVAPAPAPPVSPPVAKGEEAPRPAFVPPATATEELLAVLWEEVLDLGEGERVGAHDRFFDLGGHSLLAAQLMARVREALGVELPLAAVFQEPGLAGMARRLDAARAAAPPATEPIPRLAWQTAEASSPLSFAQERLWFLDRLDPGTPLYHIAVALHAEGDLRPAALTAALEGVIHRHAALRTAFPAEHGVPVQAVAPPDGPLSLARLPEVDLSALDAARQEGEAEKLLRELARRPFNLASGPLLAVWLLRLGPGQSVVLLVLHHIVSDGWSLGNLMRELKALYGAALTGTAAVGLPPLPLQYADYAAWQRRRLQGERLEAELAWWRERLAGAPAGLDLPLDRPRPPRPTHTGATRPLRLPGDAVQALARRAAATPFMAVLAAFQVLLSRLSGQQDLTVGVPVAGRFRPEMEDLVGLFINTLALRAELPPDLPFLESLGRARAAVIEAHAHQEVPFEKLVEELHPERDLARSPIFQVMLAPRGTPAVELDLPGVRLRPAAVDTGTAKFDLTLFLSDGDGLGDAFEHSTELFDGTTIQRWAGHLATLLAAAGAEPELPLGDLPLLSPAERHQLLVEWGEDGVVLDPRGHPAPLGVMGDLYRGGEDLQPAGERARTRPDGRLELLGPPGAPVEARRVEAPLELVEPRTPTEREVAAIWCEVLGIERAGLGRSFFDLGGHSLLAARALARVEEQFGVELPLRDLYGSPTIETLAAKIEEALLARADDARLDELLDALEGEGDPALLDQLLASQEGTGAKE